MFRQQGFSQVIRFYGKNRNYKSMSNGTLVKSSTKVQHYDYFLVLDFEATCEKNVKINPQEIIEFPCLKVNGKTFEIEAIFHKYVRPTVHPQLSSFCTELTGIIQEMVDDQPTLEETLQLFNCWMDEEDLLKEDVKCLFVTCGDWDLKVMLPGQCADLNLNYPSYFSNWINIKMAFCNVYGIWPKSLMFMLEKMRISHEGRLHSGIDDCKNIAKVLKHLGNSGYVF